MKLIYKLLIVVIFAIFGFNICCVGQTVQTTYWHCDELPIDSMNKILIDNKLPFVFAEDTIKPQASAYVDFIIKYLTADSCAEIFRLDGQCSCIDEITTLKYPNFTLYRLYIAEFVVGIDKFIIVRDNPFACFISDAYNIEQGGYHFIENSINLKKKHLEIYYPEHRKKKKIKFHKIEDKK
jgi:hypothetical protein